MVELLAPWRAVKKPQEAFWGEVGTLFPFGLASLPSHPPASPKSMHTPACLPAGLLSGRPRPQACSLSACVCPAYGRFTMFFSLLSGVWLLVSMVKQEFPNGLFPIWAGQTLVMTLPASEGGRRAPLSLLRSAYPRAHRCLAPRPGGLVGCRAADRRGVRGCVRG